MKKVFVALAMLAVSAHAGAQEQLTGVFRLSQKPLEILDEATAMALNDIAPADEELRWQVYVPETYDPTRPPGIFVFLDPRGWGGIPDNWRPLFTDQNLIWIGPNKNERNQKLEQQYAVDLNRVSLGSSQESTPLGLYAQLQYNDFRGAIYMRGSVMWKEIEAEQLEMLQRKRIVFITGANDKNASRIRSDYNGYKKAGIENVKLIFDTKRIGNLPDPDHMINAIRYLDGY